jgi:nucleolar MIF4G domain-containing protein 1
MDTTTTTATVTRKERRRQERLAKKNRKRPLSDTATAVSTITEPSPKTRSSSADHFINVGAKKPKTATSHTTATATPLISKATTGQRNISTEKKRRDVHDPYRHLDPSVAAALRRDDAEIAALEAQLGKKRTLHKEYATLDGYGDDFGDFLDQLDTLPHRIISSDSVSTRDGRRQRMDYSDSWDEESDGSRQELSSEQDDLDIDDSEDDDEELIPMKQPATIMGQEADADEELSSDNGGPGDDEHDDSKDDLEPEREQQGSDDENDSSLEPDHDASVTYQPTPGQDIYGKPLSWSGALGAPQRYIPPHLRPSSSSSSSSTANNSSTTTASEAPSFSGGGGGADRPGLAAATTTDTSHHGAIQRALNGALNRLSEDTLVPVLQSIAALYTAHPAADVNDCYWRLTQRLCVAPSVVATAGLVPVYVAALASVQLQHGDSAQLAEFVLERVVLELWKGLPLARHGGGGGGAVLKDASTSHEDENVVVESKAVCNLALLLCYFYNFGLVHCTLMYDIIRALLEACCEIDVEILLLVIRHCGRTLRSDDPTAIKEIVQLVQTKALDQAIRAKISPSRCDFMVSAMVDFKNNKRRKQDQALTDKTAKLRKAIGHIKSYIATSTKVQRCSDASLRISLQDILHAETKGRWWKVGASWAGNQERLGTETAATLSNTDQANGIRGDMTGPKGDVENDVRLLQLAAKYRMNTDARRTIFCIVMGSIDFEDCFEKLVRAEMLKNRSERDTVRVVLECCGHESSFNPFYAHLAARLCEYQPQCKFSLQLAFWDIFKQFDSLKPRKVANLAKLLFHLVAVHNVLRLNVIKAIDLADIDELPETAMIFVTIFLSSILEHFEDPGDVFRLFENSIGLKKLTANSDDEEDNEVGRIDGLEALQANLTVFLVQVLQSSPKNKKGSKFRANLKAATKACNSNSIF